MTTVERSPDQQSDELIRSLLPKHQDAARATLRELLTWTAQRHSLLLFDREKRDQPHVRFNTHSNNAFWIARGTTGDDARVELLTRTASGLPGPVLEQFRRLLTSLLPDGPIVEDAVFQIPMARLATPAARLALREAMDFALGAITALETNAHRGALAR